MQYKVIFYAGDNGKEPVASFLNTLDIKMRAKMLRTIELLQVNGPALRHPYSAPISDGIFELRAKAGTDISRVLYFFFSGRTVVLTNGFIKKTQKTPSAEIKLAPKYREDYLERKERIT